MSFPSITSKQDFWNLKKIWFVYATFFFFSCLGIFLIEFISIVKAKKTETPKENFGNSLILKFWGCGFLGCFLFGWFF